MRVVHVNDVAGVGSAAVDQARAEGLDWQLWPLPAVRGAALPTKVVRRGRDLVRFRSTGRAADVLHVHYGLFGYYAWSVRRPYVLHLHGTDVRVNLRSRLLRPLVLASIRAAGHVVYSTPDLADEVTALREDATWIPAPISPQLFQEPRVRTAGKASRGREDHPGTPELRDPTVVFASRWDPIKGLDELLETAARLRVVRPDLRLIGIDWGVGAERARAVGVELLPRMSGDGFRDLLARADVVVGQQLTGSLGVADLEALALGRPLVARADSGDAYRQPPPLWNSASLDPTDAVLSIIADPDGAAVIAARGPEWALDTHSPARFVERMIPIYESLGRDSSRR